MRWAPMHPRQMMVIALSTLVLLFCLMLATAPDLGRIDLSLPSGSSASQASSPADVTRSVPSRPDWIAHPLAPPLQELRR